MPSRVPFTTVPVTQPALAQHDEIKDNDAWAEATAPADENTAPVVLDSEEPEGEDAVEDRFLTLAPPVDIDAVEEIAEGLSHVSVGDNADDCASSDEEAQDDGEEEAASDDDDDDTMRRFLAFANRGRASGSGLPAFLAQLNRAVEDADDSDAETAELFVSCVAGHIRQERHIQSAVAEILHDEQLVVESPTDEDGPCGPRRAALARTPEEQQAFEAWLARRAAFEEIGATRLDAAATGGCTLAQLQKRGKAPARPLRRKLLKYLCEAEVHAECTYYGIRYPEPYAPYISPDIKQSGRAYVVESGTVGDKISQMHA